MTYREAILLGESILQKAKIVDAKNDALSLIHISFSPLLRSMSRADLYVCLAVAETGQSHAVMRLSLIHI